MNIRKRVRPLLGYLPTGSHEPANGYTGLFSYSVEVHAFLIGVAVGAYTQTTGDLQLAMGVISIALTVGRGQQHFTETVSSQLKKEPWYAIGGLIVGIVLLFVATSYGIV